MLVQAESGVVSVTGSARRNRPRSASRSPTSRRECTPMRRSWPRLRARAHRARRANRHLDARMSHRVDDAGRSTSGRARAESSQRAGVRHNMIVPYGAYACADGDVMFAIQNGSRMAAVLRRASCSDPRSLTTRAISTNARSRRESRGLEATIEARFRARPRADVIALLERGRHRHGRGERRPRGRGASAARGARALDAGRVARRRHSGAAAAAQSSERSAAHGPRSLARPTHRRRSRRDGACHDVGTRRADPRAACCSCPRRAGP